jgi:tRNA pseudouridine synthase 10
MNLRLCSRCAERITLECEIVDPEDCIYCEGLLWKAEKLADRILEDLRGYEFDTFLVGTRIEGSLRALENYIMGESIKYEFNRLIGKAIHEKTGKLVSFDKPDILITFNPEKKTFTYSIRSLFISGRYIKRVRNLSQTRWLCSVCGGEGCEVCDYRGRKYFSSVEELIAGPCLKITGGKDAVLHGAGREDVDARMLGTGRPFVVEIKEPVRRKVNLRELEEMINRESWNLISVRGLNFADEKKVRFLKSHPFRKKYRAKVRFESEIDLQELERAVKNLSNRVIDQRTPERVEHRRADIIRKKRVHEIDILMQRKDVAVLLIEADSGLYIKELVSGDNGRTKPSLSEILGKSARVEKLDVIDVFDPHSS